MNLETRIFIAGAETQLGCALRERLLRDGYRNLVGLPPEEPDLTHPDPVESFFKDARPEIVFLVAGASAGIGANQRRPAELMLNNLLVTAHVLDSSRRHHVSKLLYLGSSCAYPKHAPQPMNVESLLSGPLEPTSQAYATAKIAGWQLCEAMRRQYGVSFLTAIPANPFGPFDDFGAESGHVVPALMRRMHDAKEAGAESLTIWGTGAALREFIYVHDLADACLFLMRHYDGATPINIGAGREHSIAEVARRIATVVGYRGRLVFDASRPDGMPRKSLDAGPLRDLGWQATTPFQTALEETYAWFLAHIITEDAPHVRAPVSIPLSHSAG